MVKNGNVNSSHKLRVKIPKNYRITNKVLKRTLKEVQSDTRETLGVLRAISHPTRLRILRALRVEELCVCVFVSLMRQKYSKLSYHLNLLKKAGLADSKKDRNFLIYRLTNLGRRVLDSIEG